MERQRYLRTVNEDAEDNGLHSAAHRYSNSEDEGQEEADARQEYEPPSRRTSARRPASATSRTPLVSRPVSAPKERPTSAPSKTSRKSGGVNLSNVPQNAWSGGARSAAGSKSPYNPTAAYTAPRKKLSVNVSSLLQREKESLAEEVVSLRRKLHDIEDVHLRTCTENRRITADLQRTEQMLSQLEAEHSACSRGFDQLVSGGKSAAHVAEGPSNASLVRKLKSALKDQKSLNADLEAELMRVKSSSRATRVSELEAEKLTYLAETKRLTKLLSRKQHVTSPEKVAVVFGDEEPPPTARSSASPQASPRVPAAEQSTEQIYKAPQVLVSHVDTGRSVTKVSKSGLETKELKRRIKEMDKSHRALHDQAAGMRAHLEEVENKLARAQAAVAANKTASAKAKMAQAQVTQLQEEVKGLQGELAYIQKHPPAPATSEKDKELLELRDRQERLEQQRHALKAALKARDEDVLKLQQEVENAGAKPSIAADSKIVEKHRQAVLHMREELALQEEELMHCRNQVRRIRRERSLPVHQPSVPPSPKRPASPSNLQPFRPPSPSEQPPLLANPPIPSRGSSTAMPATSPLVSSSAPVQTAAPTSAPAPSAAPVPDPSPAVAAPPTSSAFGGSTFISSIGKPLLSSTTPPLLPNPSNSLLSGTSDTAAMPPSPPPPSSPPPDPVPPSPPPPASSSPPLPTSTPPLPEVPPQPAQFAASPPAPEAEAAAPDLPEDPPAAASGEPENSAPLSPEASALPPSVHDDPDGDLDGDLDEDDLGIDDLGPEPHFEGEDTEPLDVEPEPALDTGDLSGGEGSFIGSDEGSLPDELDMSDMM